MAVITAVKTDTDPIALRCRTRVFRRLMPYLLLLYIIAYLDRVNVAFAAVGGMKGDLNFTDAIMGLGQGIFFLGYFLFDVRVASYPQQFLGGQSVTNPIGTKSETRIAVSPCASR